MQFALRAPEERGGRLAGQGHDAHAQQRVFRGAIPHQQRVVGVFLPTGDLRGGAEMQPQRGQKREEQQKQQRPEPVGRVAAVVCDGDTVVVTVVEVV